MKHIQYINKRTRMEEESCMLNKYECEWQATDTISMKINDYIYKLT